MKRIIQILVLLLIITSVKAQKSDVDFLLSEPIYNDTFGVINHKTEKQICAVLMSKNMNALVADSIINVDNMRGFALPLGVYKRNDSVDYARGMLKMWQAKVAFIKKGGSQMQSIIFSTALKAIEANIEPTQKMTLREYRELYISPAVAEMKKMHDLMRDLYSPERREFMSIITENITSNVMLGFNIQELMPPTHMLRTGEIKSINPIFKAYYYDRLLREAGVQFIHFFPSRFDRINSYGPYQLTPIAVADIKANNRLANSFKRYNSMNDLDSIQDHIIAASFFAYDNWERLSYQLQADSSISKFNTYFKNSKTEADKKRKLQIFISGMTACMHHQPSVGRRIIRDYLSETDSLTKLHYDCIQKKGNKQLKKYYRSSTDAFLIMKVYHEFIEEFDTVE